MIECIYQVDQGNDIKICSDRALASNGSVCSNPIECDYKIRPCKNKYVKNSKEECDQCPYPPFRTCYEWEEQQDDSKSDNVNHPSHYTQGGIECIKAIEASMTPEEFQGYCKGNVIKYCWRFREKNGLEDLKKAQVYLGWMIESKEKQEENKK